MPTILGNQPLGQTELGPSQQTLYRPPRRHKHRIRVLNAGTWYDISDRVLSIPTVDKEKDSASTAIDVDFVNAPADGDSLSPLVTSLIRTGTFMNAAQPTVPGSQALPFGLLKPGAEIKIDGAYTADGSAPTDADLVPIFHGELGAPTKINTTPGSRIVSVHCLDYACKRLGRYFLNDTTGLNAGNVIDLIQDICDKALGTGVITVYAPASISATVTSTGISNLAQNTSAWQAIQQVADQSSVDCRYLYVDSIGDWRLVVQSISRDLSAADFTYDRSGAFSNELEVTDDYIRNRVLVEYRDASTGNRSTVEAKNQSTGDYSIDNYGEDAVYITEADTSIIDTEVEAQRMADTILADLKDLYAQASITVPFDPSIEIFDRVQVTDAQMSDNPLTLSIARVQHAMQAGDWITQISLTGTVALKQQRWIDKHGAAGVKRPLRAGDYRDSSVATDHLQDGATTSAKVGDGAIGNVHISTSSGITRLWSAGRVTMPSSLLASNLYGVEISLPSTMSFDNVSVVLGFAEYKISAFEGRAPRWFLLKPGSGAQTVYFRDAGTKTFSDAISDIVWENTTFVTQGGVNVNLDAVPMFQAVPRAWWEKAGNTSGNKVLISAGIEMLIGYYVTPSDFWRTSTFGYYLGAPGDFGVSYVDYMIAIKGDWS